MHQRLWLILPAAGFPLLIVLFVVLWQAVQRQNFCESARVARYLSSVTGISIIKISKTADSHRVVVTAR